MEIDVKCYRLGYSSHTVIWMEQCGAAWCGVYAHFVFVLLTKIDDQIRFYIHVYKIYEYFTWISKLRTANRLFRVKHFSKYVHSSYDGMGACACVTHVWVCLTLFTIVLSNHIPLK